MGLGSDVSPRLLLSQAVCPARRPGDQKQHGQQSERGDPGPLLHSGETPLGVLCPALEPSAQESHRPVGEGPEEATAMIGGLEPLCCEEKLRAGAAQPGETLLQPAST